MKSPTSVFGLRGSIAVFAALAVADCAFAQDDPGPLRFLRPALEGEAEPPADAAAAPPPAEAPSAEVPPPAGEPADGAPVDTGAAPAAAGDPATVDSPASTADPPSSPPSDGGIHIAVPPSEDDDGSIISLPGDSEPVVGPLRFGIVAGSDIANVIAALAPVRTALATTTGREVEFLPMAGYDAMIEAQMARRIDGGFYSAAAFAFAEAGCGCLDPLVAPAAADGTIAYHAIIVVRRYSPIASPADLAGRVVAAGSEDSIGARRMQLAGLAAEGIDVAAFARMSEAPSAQAAVRQLLAGAADAAFAWSSLSGPEAQGYSRGTLAELAAQGELDPSQVRVLWASPPITHGPFAVVRVLPTEARDAMATYFVALDDAEPAAYDALNRLYGGGYRRVARRDYEGVAVLTEPPALAASSGDAAAAEGKGVDGGEAAD
jgi:phosphonate transport system substrate-binding protein